MGSVHEDTLLGLEQALDYVNGDKTMARSMFVELSDEDIETNQIIYRKIAGLSRNQKQQALQYIEKLVASG